MKKIFSIILMAAPILELYALNLSTVTVADFLLMLLFLTGLLHLIYKRKITVNKEIILYIFYIIMQFFLTILFNLSDLWEFSDVFLRMGRYVFYLFILAIYVPNFLNIRTAVIANKVIAIIATIFLIIQIAVYQAYNYYIPGYLPNVPLIRTELITHATELFEFDKRCRSFFGEPAQYSVYILICISLILGEEQLSKKDFILLSFLSLGVLLAASSTGILLLFILFCCKFLIVKIKYIRPWQILFALCIPIIIILIVNMPSFQLFLLRMQKGNSASEHFSAYFNILSLEQNQFSNWLGNGMINNKEYGYLAGYIRAYYYLGFTGVFIILGILFSWLFGVNKKYRLLLIMFIILNLSGTELFGIQILSILPFIVVSIDSKRKTVNFEFCKPEG